MKAMELSQIEYSTSGQIAHVTLNNPARLNAIGPQMAAELVSALQAASADDDVRVVLLSGAGKAFCAGGDIDAFQEGLVSGNLDMAGLVADLGAAAVLIRRMPKPVIASVHRAAAGAGMGLALLADFCLAGDDAIFTTAFVTVGLVPDTGVGYVLTRTLGHLRAVDVLMSGRSLTALDAQRLGLITDVVAPERLSQATVDLIGGLLTGPRGAFAGIKQQVWAAQFNDFEEYLAMEARLQSQCSALPDFAEGVAAFSQRRPARFS